MLFSTAQPVSAQENPSNVVPIGRPLTTDELIYQAVTSVPSPIGEALPGLISGSGNARSADVSLAIGTDGEQYAYDCDQGRCVGSADDLWFMLSPDQQQNYVDQVLDALIQAFPGGIRYQAVVYGRHQGFRFIFRATQLQDGTRAYQASP
jgi:hypothetical protein